MRTFSEFQNSKFAVRVGGNYEVLLSFCESVGIRWASHERINTETWLMPEMREYHDGCIYYSPEYCGLQWAPESYWINEDIWVVDLEELDLGESTLPPEFTEHDVLFSLIGA